jgi:hypothetical protein
MSSRAARIRAEADEAEAQLLRMAQGAPDASAVEVDQPAPAPAPDPGVVAAESTAVTIEPAAPSPQLTALEREYQQLEQRYNTLQGMFAKQNAQMQTLQQQVESVVSRPPPAPALSPVSGKITAKDREEYGDPLIDLIRRGAQDALSLPLQTLVARLDRLEKGLNETATTATTAAKTATESAADRFYAKLAELHPDWETINVTPQWLTWLTETDPMAGVRRDDLLQDAHRNLNLARTAAFFTAFKRETGKSDTASGGAKSDAGRINPRELVSPASAASPQPQQSAARAKGKVWTLAEINKVYDDFAKKQIDATTFRAYEADILTATIEGRVRQ